MPDTNLICIVCPVGCRLTVTGTADNMHVSGHSCPKGVDYAHDEITNPVRMVCTTVRIKGAMHRVVPVRTHSAIADRYKLEVVKEANKIELTSPVKMGDVIISDLFGTGVNLIATRDM